MTTYDEAAAELSRMADDAAAAFNAAGDLLRECERRGLPVPDRLRGPDQDGEVELAWRAGGGGVTLVAGPGRLLCWQFLKVPLTAPNAGAAVRWVEERLKEGKVDG